MLAVAVAAVGYWRIDRGIDWFVFRWGAIAWTVSLAAKATVALASPSIEAGVRSFLPASFRPVLWVYTGLLTGIFECGTAALFVWKVKRLRRATWSEAVGFGIGFGAAETIFVALTSFALVLVSITMPDLRRELPAEYQELSIPASLAEYVAPGLERFSAIVIHAFANALIIRSMESGAWRWFWAAFAYKTAIDAIPVDEWSVKNPWLLLVPYQPFVIAGLVGIGLLSRYWQREEAASVQRRSYDGS